MKFNEFKMNQNFLCHGQEYRCTDIGTRTIIAIKLDKSDKSWYNGPPYTVAEVVWDEDDIEVCEPLI